MFDPIKGSPPLPQAAPPLRVAPVSLSCWQRVGELFKQTISSPKFWTTVALASFTFSAILLLGTLNVIIVPLCVIGSTGILALGVAIYLWRCQSGKQDISIVEDETIEDQRKEIIVYSGIPDEKKRLPVDPLKMASHIFGGIGIVNASYSNLPLEGSAISMTASSLLWFLDEKRTESDAHKTMISVLRQLIYFDQHLGEEELIPSHIRRMGVGETLTVPGGWRGTPGHAMIYQIRKDGEDSFSFIVINTGAGINYHPYQKTPRKLKYAPSIFVKGISLNAMVNSDAWKAYYELLGTDPLSSLTGRVFRDEAFLYANFLNCFSPDFLDQAQGEWSDYITSQNAGTCANDVLFAMMRRLSPDVASYKRLKNQYKLWAIKKYITPHIEKLENSLGEGLTPEQMRSSLGLIQLLQYLLSRCGKSLLKALKKEGEISLEEAQENAPIFEILEQRLQAVDKGLKGKLEKVAFNCSSLIRARLHSFTSLEQTYQKEIELKSSPLRLENFREAFQIKIVPIWERGAPLVDLLKRWNDTLRPLIEGNIHMRKEAHWHLQSIFSSMPKASDPFWNELSSAKRKEEESKRTRAEGESKEGNASWSTSDLLEVILKMGQLHELFYRTMGDAEVDNRQRLVDKTLVRKNTQVFSRLCSRALTGSDVEFTLEQSRPSWSDESPFLSFPEEIFNDEEISSKTIEPLFALETPQKLLKVGKNSRESKLFRLFSKRTLETCIEKLFSADEASKADFNHLAEAVLALLIKRHKTSLPPIFTTMITVAFIDCITKQRTAPGHRKNTIHSEFPLLPYEVDLGKMTCDINPSKTDVLIVFDYETNKQGMRALSPLTLHRSTEFSPQFYELLDHFENMTSMEQNACAMKLKGFPKKFLLARCVGVKGAYGVRDVINFYFSHLGRLRDVEEQFLFQWLIFERGVLKQALEGGTFALVLSDFVDRGFRFSREANDIATQLFFLRLGSYFAGYTKDLVPFPEMMRVTTSLLETPELSSQDRALILRERLAHQGRSLKPLNVPLCRQLLEEHIEFQSLSYPNDYEDLKLDENIERLRYKIRQFLIGRSEEEVNEIVSGIFQGAEAQLDLPYIYSKGPERDFAERAYFLNLLTLQLFYKGAGKAPLPKELIETSSFRHCFVSNGKVTVNEVRAINSSNYLFKDQFGNACSAFKPPYFPLWILKRELSGVEYQYRCFSGEFHIPFSFKCSVWMNGSKSGVLIDETTGCVAYKYNTTGMYCVLKDKREGLFLIRQGIGGDARARSFYAFDPHVLFWGNRSGEVQLIEFPSYSFKIECREDCWSLTDSYREYRLEPFQNLALFSRVPGLLVIGKGEDKRVLIPGRVLKKERSNLESFDEVLQFETHVAKIYEYYFDKKGALKPLNREAALHLIYLHIIQRNYRVALQLINKMAKIAPFTKVELTWFNAIDTTSSLLKSAEANALRLLLKIIRLENRNSIDSERETLNLRNNLSDYIGNLFELPPAFIRWTRENSAFQGRDESRRFKILVFFAAQYIVE